MVISVTFKGGKRLHDTSMWSSQSPFCRCWTSSTRDSKFETRICEHSGTSAVWNDSARLTVSDVNEEFFYLEAKAKGMVSDTLIGRLKISCVEIPKKDTEMSLKLYTDKGEDGGEIHMIMSLDLVQEVYKSALNVPKQVEKPALEPPMPAISLNDAQPQVASVYHAPMRQHQPPVSAFTSQNEATTRRTSLSATIKQAAPAPKIVMDQSNDPPVSLYITPPASAPTVVVAAPAPTVVVRAPAPAPAPAPATSSTYTRANIAQPPRRTYQASIIKEDDDDDYCMIKIVCKGCTFENSGFPNSPITCAMCGSLCTERPPRVSKFQGSAIGGEQQRRMPKVYIANNNQPIAAIAVPNNNIQSVTIAPLPDFWEERVHTNGKTFYVNHKTQNTTWNRPV